MYRFQIPPESRGMAKVSAAGTRVFTPQRFLQTMTAAVYAQKLFLPPPAIGSTDIFGFIPPKFENPATIRPERVETDRSHLLSSLEDNSLQLSNPWKWIVLFIAQQNSVKR